jgi:hypothetical protein
MTRWRTVCTACDYEIVYGDEHVVPQPDGSVSCYVHLTVTSTPNAKRHAIGVDPARRELIETVLREELARSTFPLLGPEWFQTPSDEEIARMEGEGGPPCG